jgi:curli biogenesis system outer membrane secretion channel CsgG
MTKSRWIALTALICILAAAAAAGAAESSKLRYSITVVKFENKSGWHGQWDLGDAWGAVMTDALNQSGRFIVLGEKDMRKEALEEQDLAASGRAAGGGKTVVTGQMTPAQLLVKGAITHFEEGTSGGGGGIGIGGIRIGASGGTSEVNAVVYIIDSSTGQVMASKKVYGKISKTGLSVGLSKGGFSGDIGGFKKTNAGKAIEAAVDQSVDFLSEQLESIPWTGKIVMVKGKTVYINRGTREGVQNGQEFMVGKAEVIRDPDTGEILDSTVESIGTIKALKVKEKLTVCKVVSGDGIKKGMSIILP